jgi:ABC-type nitrate/sulfonate/bicarbonate transport system permease component
MIARWGPAALRVVVPVGIVAGWWVLSADSTNPYYPPLERILERFHDLWIFASVGSDVLPTLVILALGFAIAVLVGMVNGLQLARSPLLRATAMPVLTFYRALPGIALIPVIVELFGFGDGVRVAIVALAAMPPTLIATVDGVLGVEPTLRDVGTVYGVPAWRRVLTIEVPAAAPRIFTGVQVSLQFAFIAVIAAEMVGSTRGIGYLTLLAQQTFVSADMWAGVLLLGLIGIAINGLMLLLRRWLLGWYDGAQAVAKAA